MIRIGIHRFRTRASRAQNRGWLIASAFILFLLKMTRTWGKLPKESSKPFDMLLDAITRPFNWFNELGARMPGKVFTYQRIGKLYDWVHSSLLKKVASIRDDEWQNGMYYPTKWDSNFSEFMTFEKLFHYPVTHFNFHLKQISH